MKWNKLTSRKFWLALISILTGIMGIFNFPESEIAMMAGYATALVPTVIYIITEGKIDSEAVKKIAKIIASEEVRTHDSL